MVTKPISKSEALNFLKYKNEDLMDLLGMAHKVRLENIGSKVNLCGVKNAKSGMCEEDCKFCAQSVHNDCDVDCYALTDSDEILQAAKTSEGNSASRFGIVTSGLAIEKEEEVKIIENAVTKISNNLNISPCASLGNIKKNVLLRLKKAGLTRYHCNLETSSDYFSRICTTRDWDDSVKTIKAAKELELQVCCGGIFGVGEELKDRVLLLDEIRMIDPDSVPLNFFHPVPGTALNDIIMVTPVECLKIIAVARLMMPDKEIRVCGGREYNLRDMQSLALFSGASGLMIGGYLTTSGRTVKEDIQMIQDCGFEL